MAYTTSNLPYSSSNLEYSQQEAIEMSGSPETCGCLLNSGGTYMMPISAYGVSFRHIYGL
jgi:hypothetical protein